MSKASRIGEYDGDRHETILDKFFQDVEEYLAGAPNLSLKVQVKEVAAHLIGSAKLWWCTHQAYEHVRKLVKEIKTWAALRQAIHDQFHPSNLDWII